ncbi:MAG: PhzF family phenazine biosynthesis protein [Polaromonas sp.]
MKHRPFKQVDVFSATPCLGNPLAVVLDASGLDDAALQRFARWTNLSETTFLLPPSHPSADYRVRIFTPGGELPFAGHPTLGSCHAWLQAGGQPRGDVIVQQCEAGLVHLRREPATQRLAFAAPPLKQSAPDATLLAQVMQALGVAPGQVIATQTLDNGPIWLTLLLDSVETVLALTPDMRALEHLKIDVGIAALYPAEPTPPLIARANREAKAFGRTRATPASDAPALEVRGFAASMGISEDPVTGSLQAGLAQWLIAEGRLQAPYLASQGACLGRAGLVHIERDEQGQVWVGGDCVSCIDGQVWL